MTKSGKRVCAHSSIIDGKSASTAPNVMKAKRNNFKAGLRSVFRDPFKVRFLFRNKVLFLFRNRFIVCGTVRFCSGTSSWSP
ncbi:CLUMA_CG000558, isoform A [Clunio marinus]|uniref:CLUMA_CG000558, isoform A n=1 Tax=Clunio marinus TaxID=568069 RepID=A0A1J1HFD6_9DIPT|nr:CLUMA_CG000558, isoform A [Clunio marinus]